MRLYLLRHAEAVDHAASDHDRQLTPRGISRTQAAAGVMARLGLRPAHIYSSPRVRARQTAEIVGQALGVAVEIRDEVNFSFSVEAVHSLIQGLDDAAEVMFVGHEPSMSAVLNGLTGAAVVMKKGGLARVDVYTPIAPLHGQLVWLIAPKVFDMLAAED
jgi:phosphohistidine phosphatase